MKRLIAIAAVGLLAVAIYAVAASGTPQAVTPKQFAALSKKVTALSRTVTTLKKELAATETCAFQQAAGIAQFGSPSTNQGYVYENSDASLHLETALDLADPATAPGFMLVTNKQCADIINGGKKKPVSLRMSK